MFSSNPPESSSMTAVSPPPIFRFGTFEVDVGAGELRKHGLHIKLQDQPLHLLVLLLQHPGQIVTRDELRHTLWSDQTFVDFDRGLNRAMNKLRRALCDSAETPRYIETLHRRGYRFIAPVIVHHPQQAAANGSIHNSIGPSRPASETKSKPVQNLLSFRWMAASILILATGSASVYYVESRSAAPTPSVLAARRSVAVLGFKICRGNPRKVGYQRLSRTG